MIEITRVLSWRLLILNMLEQLNFKLLMKTLNYRTVQSSWTQQVTLKI
jgi:hypothetical protein